jgi:hypothetical protein
MRRFLRTKIGLVSLAVFAVGMALMLHHVMGKRAARTHPTATTPSITKPVLDPQPAVPTAAVSPIANIRSATAPIPERSTDLVENAAYLDQLYQLETRLRETHDRQGNPVTHRANASTPTEIGHNGRGEEDVAPMSAAIAIPQRTSLRLQGSDHPLGAGISSHALTSKVQSTGHPNVEGPSSVPVDGTHAGAVAQPANARPRRFNPYGSVLKCELVFTLDSTNEQTPLIGVVMEPVYNNGELIVPAGAELHGVARPDRLRDRIFSGTEWVLVFPRESKRLNGRQLTVRGVALDRVEPDANGMTWGITDGSYGLQGRVIRTSEEQEIKRFAATFFAQAAETLEQRDAGRSGRQTVRSTPQNAMLQGLAGNLEKLAEDISAEIAQHGVFIRVPAGHQFYFYPTQIIAPDDADLPTDVAIAK